MPKALGLIETRGLVAAIEAADAMVKAANVKIVGKEQTNPALITIKIVGDVAAVKSAVDAGAAAAQKVGEVVSVHVIPQPDSQMISLFPELRDDDSPVLQQEQVTIESPEIEKVDKSEIKEIQVKIPAKEIASKEVPPKEKIAKVKSNVKNSDVEVKNSEPNTLGNLFTSQNDTISRLRQEALGRADAIKKKVAQPEPEPEIEKVVPEHKGTIKVSDTENIESLNVHMLRRLARDTENFPIKGRDISKANRTELLEFFRKYS
jgi:ethanolamine utilization protein EutM